MWEITKDKDKGYFTDKDLDRIYWTLAFMSKGKVFNPNSTLDMIKFIENNGYNVKLVPDTIIVKIKKYIQDRFPRGWKSVFTKQSR